MKTTMISTAIALALGITMAPLHAQQVPSSQVDRATQASETRQVTDRDPVDAEDFVEEASAKGLAEINTARVAMEEGGPAVKAYASHMIEAHTASNNELKAIAAADSDLDVADDATLVDRAKALMLSVRDGDNFDEAYIENQISSHEDAIELYERAVASNHPAISSYAMEKLPTLHEHLRMANALKAQVSSL